MDKYKKLKAVQGLVNSLDEQIFRQESFKKITPESEKQLIDQYFEAILKVLDAKTEIKIYDNMKEMLKGFKDQGLISQEVYNNSMEKLNAKR